jgi:hypothetical protein
MTSRLVISQPMLMPWRGMFDQAKLCDGFVFYDDVQLPMGGGRGRGFITRVQIKTAHGIEWLSLPVQRAGQGRQLICDARFLHQDWRSEHLKKIEQAYRDAPCYAQVLESVVKPIYAMETDSVSAFCIHSMTTLFKALGLAPRIHLSSQLGIGAELKSSARVLALCQHLEARDYISGLGAMDYIDYPMFEEAGVRINYMDYRWQSYAQLHGSFTPYVSVLDLLFHVGMDAAADHLVSEMLYWKNWPRMVDGRPSR